jgi:hypothetical protein
MVVHCMSKNLDDAARRIESMDRPVHLDTIDGTCVEPFTRHRYDFDIISR